MTDYEKEQAFWKIYDIERFDLETMYRGYGSSFGVMSQDGSDWVRAEDFRRIVEDLERQLQEARKF